MDKTLTVLDIFIITMCKRLVVLLNKCVTRNSKKIRSQFEFGGEHLFFKTGCEVLFTFVLGEFERLHFFPALDESNIKNCDQ